MSTEKTGQNIREEETAPEASMTHDFKRGNRVLIKSLDIEARVVEPMRNSVLCEYYDEQDKLHTIFCSPAAIVHAAKTSPEEPVSHQFAIGDIVRLNGTQQEAEVIGFDEGKAGPLLHVEIAGSQGKVYFPVRSVTLVRSGGAAQANHPSKIETTANARDVTSVWDGGHKKHAREGET